MGSAGLREREGEFRGSNSCLFLRMPSMRLRESGRYTSPLTSRHRLLDGCVRGPLTLQATVECPNIMQSASSVSLGSAEQHHVMSESSADVARATPPGAVAEC